MDGDAALSVDVRDGPWRTWTRRPASGLCGLVRSYHGFVVDSGLPRTDRVLPAPTVTLILSFGDLLHLRATPGSNHRDGCYVSFVAGLDDRHVPMPEVRHAWHRIRDSGGRVRVGELAADTGWSRRHLAERFRRELGLSPKTTTPGGGSSPVRPPR